MSRTATRSSRGCCRTPSVRRRAIRRNSAQFGAIPSPRPTTFPGGNCRTAMIACVCPLAAALEDTVTTLQFACRAKAIRNHAKINVQVRRIVREGGAQLSPRLTPLLASSSLLSSGERRRRRKERPDAVRGPAEHPSHPARRRRSRRQGGHPSPRGGTGSGGGEGGGVRVESAQGGEAVSGGGRPRSVRPRVCQRAGSEGAPIARLHPRQAPLPPPLSPLRPSARSFGRRGFSSRSRLFRSGSSKLRSPNCRTPCSSAAARSTRRPPPLLPPPPPTTIC